MNYLVLLYFRFPPLHLSYSHPNVLVQDYIILDSAFAFAKYYETKLKNEVDWRKKYLEDSLTKTFDEFMDDLNISFRTSYLLPAYRIGNKLVVITPFEYRVTFKINEDSAEYVKSVEGYTRENHIEIILSKRDDIIKVFSIYRNLKSVKWRTLSDIDPSRRAYKSIQYTVRLKYTNLLWVSIVEGVAIECLNDYLNLLQKFGIGKKRNMGWGDLIRYEILKINNENISTQKVIHKLNGKRILEIIRPISPYTISDQILRQNKSIIPLQIELGFGSDEPPYWQRKIIIKRAKFIVNY